MAEHQIINEIIDTPMGYMHNVRCSCGKRVAMTNSAKIANRNAEYHLEVAKSDEEWGPDSAAQKLERGPR